MSSLRRIRASRANGAHSKGPKTPEGKRRSSMNALRHGLLAKCVVLENESRQGFEALVAEHVARFAPADGVDLGFIEEMAAAWWRIRRAWTIETRLVDEALAGQPQSEEGARIAAAFAHLAASPQFGLLHRYESRLHRAYQRALHNLLLLRESKLPNEPNPISGHRAALPIQDER